ncbi:tRNA adenosine(34) deaminase TadA [Neisseria zalophi]|uniref:tRNA-specific adenosine deaminase n=1 Tax=Neisseria zalophi TaxID=640030 RepID=A0A5J6PUV9_9NEIS|nr:tRNA adenosine(34) deaminase TadA [Neisseria zalophi]QEY26489.1 cytidine deaminase [Neisseria zalophi]
MQLTHPPLTEKVLKTLQSIGIHSQADLQKYSAVTAFLLLKAAGLTITRSTLWQLVALQHNIRLQDLKPSEKTALLERVRQHPPVAIFPPVQEMEYFMKLALQQAQESARIGEIPVGAVVVKNGQPIAAAHNSCISGCDISRHAEISALAQAGHKLQNYRLDGCDVYVTLEPCTMCASALIQARVRRVIYGAKEPKTGAAGSIINLFADRRLNSHTAIKGGILADESQDILQNFFNGKRATST